MVWWLFAVIVLLAAGLRWVNFASFPPGLWYDEAYTLEGARRIVQEGDFQIYYPGKHGEPAIFWLSALALRLGAGHLAPRWVSSVSGVLGVVLLFFTVRDVLGRTGRTANWLALSSAGVLAINFVYLFYTRMSWQAALATPLFVLTIWCFWRGLDTGCHRDFAIAGVAAGAAQYTSVSARLLPLVCLLVVSVWLGARDRRVRWWARWLGLLVTGGCALFVYLPMAREFLVHPDWFARRLNAAAEVTDLWSNVGRTLGGWAFLGDAGLHSLPNRPIYAPPMAALLVLGALVVLWRWRNPTYSIWLAWLVGCLPGGFLSSPTPMFYRFLTAMPAASVLCAVGGQWLWERLVTRFPNRRVLVVGLLAGIFAFSTGATTYDYFVRWANWEKLPYVMDVGKWRAAEVIQASWSDEKLLVTMPERFEAMISYAAHTRSVYPRIFDGERCFIYPADTANPVRYVAIQGYEHRSQTFLGTLYPDLEPIVDPIFEGTEPYFVEFVVPPAVVSPVLGEMHSPLTYGEIVLHGMLPASRKIRAGQTLDVTLTWRAPHRTTESYTVFVHLLDGSPEAAATPLRAQHDTIPCLNSAPTQTWEPDEYIVEVHSLAVPADLAPDDYLLGVGVYNTATLERMIPDDAWVQWNEAIVDIITVTAP